MKWFRKILKLLSNCILFDKQGVYKGKQYPSQGRLSAMFSLSARGICMLIFSRSPAGEGQVKIF